MMGSKTLRIFLIAICLMLLPAFSWAATYTANGTYTYNSGTGVLTLNWTASDFACNGPEQGKTETKIVLSITSTTMTWGGNDNIIWTRADGTAGDITGTWAADIEGNPYQATLNPDGSCYVVGNIAKCDGGNNLRVSSQHWDNGYYARPVYKDQSKTAKSVIVTGPWITGSLSLAYDNGQWESWTLPGQPVYFGITHPATPLTYIFTITDSTGAQSTAAATVDCFMEYFAINLSVTKDIGGNPVFNWTKVPDQNMRYNVELNGGGGYWRSDSLFDASSATYQTLTPGHYDWDVVVSPSSGNCQSFAKANFTVQQDGNITNGPDCNATLSNDLKLHIPIITFNGQSYWADFQYVQGLDMSLANAGQLTDSYSYSNCAPSTLSNDLKLHIPVLVFNGVSYWADFQYSHDLIVTLTGAGH